METSGVTKKGTFYFETQISSCGSVSPLPTFIQVFLLAYLYLTLSVVFWFVWGFFILYLI